MNLPVIIYNIDKKALSKNITISSNCFYFYSYQNISVEILSNNATLFSVKEVNNVLVSNEASIFNDNFGYTLYVAENLSVVSVKISNSFQSVIYTFTLKIDNTENSELYNDLLTNANLPKYAELEGAIIDEFNKKELIKRLLLDYRKILQYKGTTKSVEKFFEFIGFIKANLSISDEYFDTKNSVSTLLPNKHTDYKTGFLHVLYDNWNSTTLDEFNFPIREIQIEELESFKLHLINAIALANKYFTIDEQEINFFALQYSSNMYNFFGITSNMSVVYENDVCNFRKNISINAKNYIKSTFEEIKVKNCLQYSKDVYKSEVKIYQGDVEKTNNELFFIDYEIFDDVDITELEFDKLARFFGVVLHINITALNLFVEIEFYDKNNELTKLTIPKFFCTEEISKQIAILNTSQYLMKIKFFDEYNNYEEYFYDFNVSANVSRVDFECFNSYFVDDIFKYENSITQDVSSSSQTLNRTNNYILEQSLVPQDLSNYYQIQQGILTRYLTENSEYIIEELNRKNALQDITNSIPLLLLDSFLDVITLKYDSDYELKMRVYDASTCSQKIVAFNEISTYQKYTDKIYVSICDVFDRNNDDTLQDTKTAYYIITTTESGILLDKNLFDFVLVHKTTDDVVSIYDIENNASNSHKKIPLNYDINLFLLTSEIATDFVGYISDGIYKEMINDVEYVVVKSLFPRLCNMNISNDTYRLKIGDVLLCRLNQNYVVDAKDIIWYVYDSFTKKLLFSTTDYALKYRINDLTCFDVKCKFVVDGNNYEIRKDSLISSFK